MKSFKETIYFNREKESNWDIEEKAANKGFKNSKDIVYLGYEVEMEVEVREDLKHKVFRINGIDVSDKEIYV
jgi:virulence-associated protein VapD